MDKEDLIITPETSLLFFYYEDKSRGSDKSFVFVVKNKEEVSGVFPVHAPEMVYLQAEASLWQEIELRTICLPYATRITSLRYIRFSNLISLARDKEFTRVRVTKKKKKLSFTSVLSLTSTSDTVTHQVQAWTSCWKINSLLSFVFGHSRFINILTYNNVAQLTPSRC